MSSNDKKTPDEPTIIDFVDALNDVNEKDPSTVKNKQSMSDNKGGRITFDEGEDMSERPYHRDKNPQGFIRGVE